MEVGRTSRLRQVEQLNSESIVSQIDSGHANIVQASVYMGI